MRCRDGSGLRDVTPDGVTFGGSFRDASWSPDGRRIVFYALSAGGGGPWRLYIENVANRALERVITMPPPIQASPASFSPDGQWLAMSGGSNGLWLVSVDGAVKRQITDR